MPDKSEQDEIFDFGFSFEDPNEQSIKNQIKKSNDKAKKLYDTIVPFLDNLSSNPDQPTIYWPNRVEKISLFKKKLLKLLEEE